jgi:tetratricopeptide (TPR) repeat protein
MTRRLPDNVRQGIAAAKSEKYLVGLTLLGDFYDRPGNPEQVPDGLSWYGVCVAMINKAYDHAIECCRVALERQPKNAVHYLNLGRIHVISGNRKKAVEAAEQGLAVAPHDVELIGFRQQLGVRARPTVPFLERAHPVNVTIGQLRHATKKKRSSKKRKTD